MLSLPTPAPTHQDRLAPRDDDQGIDGPLVRRLVVALVCSGVLSTLALVVLLGALLELQR
jgi:hypothetical protein